MHKFLFSLILVIATSFSARGQHKETITQNRADYVGIKDKSFFKQHPHAKWYFESYDDYKLDQKSIKKLKKHIHKFKIKIFMSVWCHDSHREIPRLFKILEAVNFNEENIEVIALDRAKKTPNNLQEGYNLKRTPTLIFYKNGKEVSRFVESPRKSLEKDILKIVSGKTYKHTYYKD